MALCGKHRNSLGNTGNTKDSQELREQIKKYIKDFKTSDKKNIQVIPSIEGLSRYIGIPRKTLMEWKASDDEQHSKVRHLLEGLLTLQAQILLNKGLSDEFNAAVCKMVLTKHGYSDKQELEVSGDMGIVYLPKRSIDGEG